jgi:hypothetical protein
MDGESDITEGRNSSGPFDEDRISAGYSDFFDI